MALGDQMNQHFHSLKSFVNRQGFRFFQFPRFQA